MMQWNFNNKFFKLRAEEIKAVYAKKKLPR